MKRKEYIRKHNSLYTVTIVTRSIESLDDERGGPGDEYTVYYGKPEKRVYRGVLYFYEEIETNEIRNYLKETYHKGTCSTYTLITINNKVIEISSNLMISFEIVKE